MSDSIGPVIATGIVTIVNENIFHDQPWSWKVPVGTALASVGFALAERVWPKGTIIVAWTTLITVLLSRTSPDVPSPTESALTWWNKTYPSST